MTLVHCLTHSLEHLSDRRPVMSSTKRNHESLHINALYPLRDYAKSIVAHQIAIIVGDEANLLCIKREPFHNLENSWFHPALYLISSGNIKLVCRRQRRMGARSIQWWIHVIEALEMIDHPVYACHHFIPMTQWEISRTPRRYCLDGGFVGSLECLL